MIEIEVKPTSSFPISIPGPVPLLKPIFLDENGKCFVRRAASVWQVSKCVFLLCLYFHFSDLLPGCTGNDHC